MRKRIMPLCDIPIEEQLRSKQSYCKNALRHFAQELYKTGTPIRLDVTRMPCHLNPIVRSPAVTAYRNVDEFSIWRGIDGETITVGFMVFPISKHGDTVCIEPDGCEIMKEVSIRMGQLLQEFMRNQAKLGVSHTLGEEGGWRRFQVKSNTLEEIMVTGFLNPRTLTVQQVLDERNNFRDFIVSRTSQEGLKLVSLYFQPCPHNSCPSHLIPFELLYGNETIVETINGYKFQISPETHFHQSTPGSEILCKSIRKTIEDCFPIKNTKPLLIDVNCNAGILPIQLADMASRIVGIDRRAQAIDDARANAKLNGVANSEFIYSTLEVVIERVLEKYSQHRQETMVLCAPSKMGLHHYAIDCLRRCNDVKKIVYVTSKPDGDGFQDNMKVLCQRSSGRMAPPFVPIAATPVDICPNLDYCELVVALERLES